jgi:hypothetical protein
MTVADWMRYEDPEALLNDAQRWASNRKMSCFALACLVKIIPLLRDARTKEAIRVLANYLDGKASPADVWHAWHMARDAWNPILDDNGIALAINPNPGGSLERFSARLCSLLAIAAMTAGQADREKVRIAENQRQVRLIHDIFGPLGFRSVPIDSSWLSANVQDLTRTLHKESAFNRLPILADALMEAGCTCTDILSHCGSGGPRVRGCWVVDLLLSAMDAELVRSLPI